MADTSERIIILSAVVLLILLWLPNSGLMRTIGKVYDIEGEVLMPAWLLGGKIGGGSGPWFDVNMSDLQQFPHLIEAFKEKAKARTVHAGHVTYCPAEEAFRIIEFFGEEYDASESNYWYNLTSEDGSFYSFSMMFGWAQPIIS